MLGIKRGFIKILRLLLGNCWSWGLPGLGYNSVQVGFSKNKKVPTY